MDIIDFTVAWDKCQATYNTMIKTPTETNIGEFMLVLAINGLLMRDITIGELPQPLCMMRLVSVGEGKRAARMHYIYPADQP